jgi:hypothetical protein
MMEAVRTYEKSVHFNVTRRRYIPEDTKYSCEIFHTATVVTICRLRIRAHEETRPASDMRSYRRLWDWLVALVASVSGLRQKWR